MSLLRIEPMPVGDSAKGMVMLDPAFMSQEKIKAGDVVEITTGFGKSIIGRVAPPLSADKEKGFIRMDQYQTQSIKAMLGDPVEVEKTTVSNLEKVVLSPLMDVSHLISDLEEYLVKTFSALKIAVCKRTVLFAKLPGAAAGTRFKVVELKPVQGVITESTAIEIKYLFTPGEAQVTFEDVGGLGKEVKLVRELVELPVRFPEAFRQLGINPPRGVVLYGPAGSGKTHLTKALANELDAEFHYINGPELIGTQYGETEANLRKTFEQASHHLPSIILVDEIDVLIPKRGASGTFTDTRMSTQFLELMDGLKRVEGVMVIGTTNRVDSVDHAARRPGRFDREIFIGPPNSEGRLEVLKIHTRGMPLSKEAADYLPAIAKSTHGFVGADLMELCREAGLNSLRRTIGDRWAFLSKLELNLQDLVVEKDDFIQAISKLRPSALREAVTTIPDVRWEDIGGLGEVKDRLRELVEKPLLHPEVFAKMNIKPPTGVLLYGPPGTGKTLLAKAIANECNANFISVKGPEIFSKWVGESEEAIRHIFRVARQVSPTIIFFDQLDALAPKRSGIDSGARAAERVVNQLLAEMDGIEPLSGIIIVGATNRLDLLDPAILRPGRFGVHLFVPLPDQRARREVLELKLCKIVLDGKLCLSDAIEWLLERTDGFSGADLDVVCQEATLQALRQSNYGEVAPVSLELFEQALKKVYDSRKLYADQEAVEA